MLKFSVLLLFSFLCVSFCSNNLEIYIFNVGQADSQLLVYPSGYTILIDLGELDWNLSDNAKYVAARIEKITGKKHINTIVVTHTHLDHIGTVGYGGIWGLVNKFGFTFDKIIDRDAGSWKDSNRDGKCDKDKEIEYRIIGKTSPTTDKWLCWVYSKDIKAKREIAELCSTSQIKPKDKGSLITVVGVDGHGSKTKSGQPVAANWSAVSNGPSENAYSIGLLIQYGDFSYVTMGDMDGSYYSGNTYSDVESLVSTRLASADLYHANHHGSPFSSGPALLNVIKPTAAVFSVGKDNEHNHPGQETLDRLDKLGTEMFLTSRGVSRNYHGAVIANGDITIVTDGKKFFEVTAGKRSKKYKLKGTKFPKCKDGSLQKEKIVKIK